MMVMYPDGFEKRWSTAPMRGLAAGCFELNRSVVDVEAFAESAVDALKNRSAI